MKHNKSMKKETIYKILFFYFPFLILISISLVLMYHAKFITDIFANHFERQILWFTIGFIILFVSHFLPLEKLFKYSFIFYIINIILLILVLFIGESTNGAKAWLSLKYFSFQPSEFMKLSYTLFLAHYLAKKKPKKWYQELWLLFKVFILFLIPSLLIFLEPDTGAILFLAIITIVSLFFSNIRKRWLIILSILILAIGGIFTYFYLFKKEVLLALLGSSIFYRIDRLLSIGNGMQIENALIAIGSAPFFRFNLTEVGIYIPEAPTDFAFSLCANVFGISGELIIILCFFILDSYLHSYSQKIIKKEQKIFATSFLCCLIVNEFINISMNLGLFPIIGIPLPFVSYGGSSTIVSFLYLAFIFSLKRKKLKN